MDNDPDDPMVQPLQPWESPYWDSALADLEENHPQRLLQLLKSAMLEQYLTKQVDKACEVSALLQSNHDLDDAERMQLAAQAIVTEANPNAPPSKELPSETKELLRRFNQMLAQRPSLPMVRLSEL